jgi:transforming growth factor-beta-induced protein
VLKYHVAQGDRTAQAVLSSGQVRMLDGNFAPVTVASGEAYIAGAKILKTDITASNGIIHVIGGVMLPPSGK